MFKRSNIARLPATGTREYSPAIAHTSSHILFCKFLEM